MPVIHAYAGSLPHYLRHIFPVWRALPPEVKGKFFARGEALQLAHQLGVEVTRPLKRFTPNDLVLTASYEDYRTVSPAKVILQQHGSGQTYGGDPKSANISSHSGGRGRERVVLHLATSERDAENCRAARGVATAVGVPYLDSFWPGRAHIEWSACISPPDRVVEVPRTVVVSFHANVNLINETRWAFPHFHKTVASFVRTTSHKVIGHSHPRARRQLEPFWKSLDVPFEPNWWNVMRTADLYVCDNSSTLYEFASLGLPVLVLNAPWYRRDVHHGLRFWDAIPGHECDYPDEFASDIDIALKDSTYLQERRQAGVMVAYENFIDGKATNRAVNAILDVMDAS